MKKLLLSICAISLLTVGAKAQTAPDMGFEVWSAIAPPFITSQDPNGWASLNALVGVTSTPQSVFKETTTPAVGTISAKVTTVKIQGATIPSPYGGTLDTAGILAIGSVALASPPNIHYGFTFAARPNVLSFQSKYTPGAGGDSAFVLAYLTRYNVGPGTRDTIATGKYATGATTTSYATNSLTMTYKAAFVGVIPDTAQIFISSSVYSHDGAKIGSAFTVDAFAWSAFVSTNDIDGVVSSVNIFPNPANNMVTLECSVDAAMVDVMDVTGRKVASYTMQNNKSVIETTSYAKGAYLYSISDKTGKIINRGKFEVAR